MVNRNEKDESKRNTISLSPRAMNRIIDLVNSKIPKEKCVFRSDEEERFLLLGISNAANICMVCHCYRESDTVIRIISARKATKNEVNRYERGI